MSHLHIPDGVLPWWLVGLGWLALAVALRGITRAQARLPMDRRLPRLGFAVAFMALAMSVEVVPPAYHLDLSVLAGILLGPALGFLAGAAAVFLLALVGHGGATVIGLNGLVIGSEVALAAWAYGWLRRHGAPAPAAAAVATVLALAGSTTLTVGILVAAGLAPPGVQAPVPGLRVAAMLALVLAAVALGWVLEAGVAAMVVGYLARVRPALIAAPAP